LTDLPITTAHIHSYAANMHITCKKFWSNNNKRVLLNNGLFFILYHDFNNYRCFFRASFYHLIPCTRGATWLL